MQQILKQRRDSNHQIHFRDDLSEYSSPSLWGEGSGPLSLFDHRLVPEGLQARRTAGEALLQLRWERQCEADAEACSICGAGGAAVRLCLGLRLHCGRMRSEAPRRSAVVFMWSEVHSLILLPLEGKGPYLIAVTTCRLREGSREWILQAGSLRGRARWAVEMSAAILRERNSAAGQGRTGAACQCCSSGRNARLSTVLFMDMLRLCCEAARLQPSAEGMERIVEVLVLMMEGREHSQTLDSTFAGLHFPLAALRRFSDSVQRVRAIFVEWQWWRRTALLLQSPEGWDVELWRGRVLPFVWPVDASLRDPKVVGYPTIVDAQLAAAAERCRRILL
mmetsp:Transcript_5068/g.11877  ORF Transcript_5068/g.11877 Transcript_5068/m.11877 type:complete len:335 (+) Transcript_5068:63-1067(+)|eukprot:CAMPEP_0171062264 /NCGR_PEP_ID=MMETSP0766_2-20121228/4967_1 /TAXON_ID=439317 /ORGANISM="Gambierdiscus australes, Strain CAWD 149" /LENGTH=334 /DNA_ID=CAMNT_0011518057 /DNA_START=62 /DNA_END=1066 /DNA_ORIENTATION=-